MFSCFRNAKGMALLAAAVVIGGYLVIWHQQHLAVALPFLVFLACPLMHLFMHGGMEATEATEVIVATSRIRRQDLGSR